MDLVKTLLPFALLLSCSDSSTGTGSDDGSGTADDDTSTG